MYLPILPVVAGQLWSWQQAILYRIYRSAPFLPHNRRAALEQAASSPAKMGVPLQTALGAWGDGAAARCALGGGAYGGACARVCLCRLHWAHGGTALLQGVHGGGGHMGGRACTGRRGGRCCCKVCMITWGWGAEGGMGTWRFCLMHMSTWREEGEEGEVPGNVCMRGECA